MIQYLVQPKSSANVTAVAHDNQITLDHLEKFSQSLTARVLIGYIALLLMGFLWLCLIWTINAIFGLSIGKDAMYNVGRFVRRRRRNLAQNNANVNQNNANNNNAELDNNNNNNNAEVNNNNPENNNQVVEQPQAVPNNDGENNNENNNQNNNDEQVPAAVVANNNGKFFQK